MSIELPNGKISLTLPEQVGHNAKQISKIFQLLDGLNVQDNVVVLENLSHVLNAQEITVLQQAVAFIVYDGHLYIKSGESGSNAYFDIVFSITPPGTAITFASSRITANLSNGALSIANSSVNAYSTTQIDTLVSAKANITYVDSTFAPLAGANFTGPITSPSIIEDMTGYSVSGISAHLTLNYVGVVKNGNKLTFVASGIYNHSGDSGISVLRFNIPSAVGQKLFPAQIPDTTRTDILSIKGVYFQNGSVYLTGTTCVSQLSKVSNTALDLAFYGLGYLTSGKSYLFRYEDTFLLSDSLAS